jgi:predicted permease
MVEVLLVFYLLVGSGFFLKTLRVFKTEDTTVFVNYIIYFALPVAVLSVIHDFHFKVSNLVIPFSAWFSQLISTFLVFTIFKRLIKDEKSLKTFFLTTTFGNTAFVGYPVNYALFGDKGLAYAILYDVLGNFLVVTTFAIYIITGKPDWRLIYKFPPLGALILAFLLKPIPLVVLKSFFGYVKASITPTILFALGLRLEPKGVFKNLKWATISVAFRMLLIPSAVLCFLIFLSRFIDIDFTTAAVTLLQSAMPPFVMSVVLSEKYKLNSDLAIASVNLGLVILLISLPLWFAAAKFFFG